MSHVAKNQLMLNILHIDDVIIIHTEKKTTLLYAMRICIFTYSFTYAIPIISLKQESRKNEDRLEQ